MSFLVAASGFAQLRKIETKDLRLLFYDPKHTFLAPQLMKSFENSFSFHKKMFGYTPKEKVSILLEDFSDYGHGGADAIPTSRVNVGIAPFNYIYETVPSNERMSWMMNHELAHVVELDGSRQSDRFFRRMFGLGKMVGKVVPDGEDPLSMAYAYLSVPRRYAPRWYHEGIAVFLETWMSGGLGRSLGGYDEMVFRSLVREDGYIYDLVGLEAEGTTIDFQVGVNSYLYGTRFVTWLALEYGPEKVLAWAKSGDGTKAYFGSQFQQVFGRKMGDEWKRWIASEKVWQQKNLEILRKYPVTGLKRMSKQALGSVSNSFYDANTKQIYAAVRYPGPMAHLAAIDTETGVVKRLHNIDGAALYFVSSLAYDAVQRRIFFTTENNDYRDLNVYDLGSGKAVKLMDRFRGGDMVWDQANQSLWAVRHEDGLSTLVELKAPFREALARVEFAYGTDLFDLEVSPDGKRLVGMVADSSGRQRLVSLDVEGLKKGDGKMETLQDFEFSNSAAFTFSPDGRYLYGSSYYSGASNLFRVDLAQRKLEALTNSETGLFWPSLLEDGRLMAYEYTSQGFYPVIVDGPNVIEDVSAVPYLGQEVVKKYPQVKGWKMPDVDKVDLSQLTTSAGEFHPVRNLRGTSLIPIVQGYKDSLAYGARMDFSDGLGLAGLHVTASVSPDKQLPWNERGHASVDFRNFDWRVKASYNNADFYDLFGPTKTSRKGFAGLVGKKKSLVYKSSRTLDLDMSVAGYAGLDRLPEFQNIRANFDKFLTGRMSLNYAKVVRTLGAVDEEKGTKWKLIAQSNVVNGTVLPRVYGHYDAGFLTPLRNSPVWVRSSAGKSFGERAQPFANFFFGGFGNNWVDHQEVSRYREYYSFAGVELNQVGATDYAKTMVEWNLPPKHFRNVGTTSIYCNWMRLSLFTGVLGGNLASAKDRQLLGNVGMQVDFKVVVATYLNTMFSVGVAEAQDRTGRRSSQVMVSLKLQ